MKKLSSSTIRKVGSKLMVVSLTWLSVVACSDAANKADDWKIQKHNQATIVIQEEVLHDNKPSNLFGFNINYRQFEQQLWDKKKQQPKEGILEALTPFKESIFRYPGGSVANSFHWQQAKGEVAKRGKQSSFYNKKMQQVQFGVDEYIEFIEHLNGTPWYVLNLVGLDVSSPYRVSDLNEVAANNVELVSYLKSLKPNIADSIHLQLGNELDRSKFEWLPETYAERAKATADAIQKEHNDMRFISFLRDFKWTYRSHNKELGSSRPKDYMSKVMKGLGHMDGYSLHHYYDGNRVDGNSRPITFWLRHLSRSIKDYESMYQHSPSIWVTEHGRQPMSKKPNKDDSERSTSNLSAAISTADYLIALSQFPEVKGAVWHGLNAGAWQLFDYRAKHGDLRPRPIYWGLRVLRKMELPLTLKTDSISPNLSEYAGGYDIRAAAHKGMGEDKLGVRVINRASQKQTVTLQYKPFAKQNKQVKHYSISAPDQADPEKELDQLIKVDLDPLSLSVEFDADGKVEVELPASSVSTLLFESNQLQSK